eukprot:scaffold52953_cov70-Phaeocystis_antarctica.AAC.1
MLPAPRTTHNAYYLVGAASRRLMPKSTMLGRRSRRWRQLSRARAVLCLSPARTAYKARQSAVTLSRAVRVAQKRVAEDIPHPPLSVALMHSEFLTQAEAEAFKGYRTGAQSIVRFLAGQRPPASREFVEDSLRLVRAGRAVARSALGGTCVERMAKVVPAGCGSGLVVRECQKRSTLACTTRDQFQRHRSLPPRRAAPPWDKEARHSHAGLHRGKGKGKAKRQRQSWLRLATGSGAAHHSTATAVHEHPAEAVWRRCDARPGGIHPIAKPGGEQLPRHRTRQRVHDLAVHTRVRARACGALV